MSAQEGRSGFRRTRFNLRSLMRRQVPPLGTFRGSKYKELPSLCSKYSSSFNSNIWALALSLRILMASVKLNCFAAESKRSRWYRSI